MLETFLATLSPMLTLFLCILVGFALKKFNILPDNAGKVMAKLESWVFCPALSFCTMARFFTVDTISFHATNILISVVGVTVAMLIAIPLSSLFVKDNSYDKGVYQYALAFANMGYVGARTRIIRRRSFILLQTHMLTVFARHLYLGNKRTRSTY